MSAESINQTRQGTQGGAGAWPARQLDPDPELVGLDFSAQFAEQPDEAVVRLEALMYHRDSCLGRIALVRTLSRQSDQPLQDSLAAPLSEDLAREIELLATEDLFASLVEGGLLADRVERLHRLTLSPAGLWTAHCRLQQTLAAIPPQKPLSASPSSKAAALLALAADTPFVGWVRQIVANEMRALLVGSVARTEYRHLAHELLNHFVVSSWLGQVSVLEFYFRVGEAILAREEDLVGAGTPSESSFYGADRTTVNPRRGETINGQAYLFRALCRTSVADGVPEVYVAAVLRHSTGRTLGEIAKLLELPPDEIEPALLEASADLKIELV